MRKYIFSIILVLLSLSCFSQSMLIGNNTSVVVHDGGKIIFSNSTSNNIVKTGSQGGIRTLGENAEIIFKNVNQLGDYTIPFSSSQGNTIPFKFTITTLGSNSGDIHFTTWETDATNVPYPSTVTHMTDASGMDNTNKVINRFWKIDMVDYTVKPKGEYGFTYDDNDLSGTLIDESGLVAQRWNTDDLLWGDWLYSPTANVTTNTVNILIQNPEDEYSVWTLVDQADPLPIELVRFTTNCNSGNIEWVTFTETNSAYFVVQHSEDGMSWVDGDVVISSGYSNQLINYRVPNGNHMYYRLKSVDGDGTYEYSQVIINDCIASDDINILIYPNPFVNKITIISNHDITYCVRIYDLNSKLLVDTNVHHKTVLDLNHFASGTYLISIIRGDKITITKLIKY